MKAVGFKENIAEVKGITTNRNPVKFSLTTQEIKHIRRVLSLYEKIHPPLYEFGDTNLSRSIYRKFSIFGNIRRGLSPERKRAKMKNREFKCSFEGCNEVVKLTTDHIRPLASDEGTNKAENLRYLCPQHHLLRELESVLWRKEHEVIKLREKIQKVKSGEDPQILGYQCLKNTNITNHV